MRFKIFLFLAFFATSAVSAQLYDNRNRYLQSPHSYNRFAQELDGPPKKPAKRYTPSRTTSSRNSYNYYRNRVNRYSRAYLTTDDFYRRFRDPDIFDLYANSKKSLGGSESGINLKDCHCNYGSDLKAFNSWYRAQQMARQALLRQYEGLFEKKLEKVLNKSFPNFKAAQKAFYKEYGKIKDNEYRQQLSNMTSNDLYRSQLDLGRNASYYKIQEYLLKSRREDLAKFGELIINGRRVREMSRSNSYRDVVRLASLNRLTRNSYNNVLISRKIFHELGRNRSLFYDYLSEKYVDHYNSQNNYEYRLGAFNGYIEHYQNQVGYHIKLPTHSYGNYMLFKVPFNENELRAFFKKRLEKNIDYTYRYKMPTIETAIANVALFELDEFSSRELSLIRHNRLKDKEHKKRLYGKIQQAVLNKKVLKNAVTQYFKNAVPLENREIQTIKDAVGSRLENKPFLWSELPNLRRRQFQINIPPDVILSIDLALANYKDYQTYLKTGFDPGINKHKGIADVLKYIYDNPKYWSVEGATIRHFLESKTNVKIPSSLSNRDLGKLFDFGGGNSNTLTIAFSDYARKYITNFHHGDGKYGMSLFTDPFKLQALREILNGNTVDFENEIIIDSTFKSTKEYCVLKELISTQNNLLKRVSNQFTQNKSKFRLRFTTVNKPSDDAHMRTGPDKDNPNIINVKLNLSQKGGMALDLASSILHEAIHAELHRIYLSGNKAPYNYPKKQYDWLVEMYEFYQNENNPATPAHHYYMSTYHIAPLTKALRDFDKQKHPLENYKYLAWDGLYEFGKTIGLINRDEFDRLERLLLQTVYSDSYESNCN